MMRSEYALHTARRLGSQRTEVPRDEHPRPANLADELAATDGIDEEPGAVRRRRDRVEPDDGVRNPCERETDDRGEHDSALASCLQEISARNIHGRNKGKACAIRVHRAATSASD
jgi:hypothetical protein